MNKTSESMEGAMDSSETKALPLSQNELAEKVYSSLPAKRQEQISLEDVARVTAELKLESAQRSRRLPALRIRHLRFAGEKRLLDHTPSPFEYAQAFASGNNVICIPDNEVGKSSILKTIKYALTGDNSDYDADVRSWITDVWLAFDLDQQEYTVLHSNRGEARALLVPGRDFRQLETVAGDAPHVLFDVTEGDEIRAELQRFFFQRLGLGKLSWTQRDDSTPDGVAERSTSWLTYFQALQIPDGGDRYLLCDPQHAIGNQEGLIFSAFLGLHLVEPLNQLGVAAAKVRKAKKQVERSTAEQVKQATEEVARLEIELRNAIAQVRRLQEEQADRQRAVLNGMPAQQLSELHSGIASGIAEKARLEVEREELNRNLQHLRARQRQLREAVALQLHFTGLEVSLCPSCDNPVDPQAVAHEHRTNQCRLCGKAAQGAEEAELEALKAMVEDVGHDITAALQNRDAIGKRLEVLRQTISEMEFNVSTLTKAAEGGLAYALPTPEEAAKLETLNYEIGRLQAELVVNKGKAEPTEGDNERDHHLYLLGKVRDFLKNEAQQLNHVMLARLSSLTQDVARTIGVESISDVTCSPLGTVELRKHGKKVSFTGVKNEGERLRIKLAFFLAMMRLGREQGLGRHPGFLLIDQPGSGEMVTEDFEALADVFKEVDNELGEHVQIICCTARPEFKAATAASKVYGPKDPPYAF